MKLTTGRQLILFGLTTTMFLSWLPALHLDYRLSKKVISDFRIEDVSNEFVASISKGFSGGLSPTEFVSKLYRHGSDHQLLRNYLEPHCDGSDLLKNLTISSNKKADKPFSLIVKNKTKKCRSEQACFVLPACREEEIQIVKLEKTLRDLGLSAQAEKVSIQLKDFSPEKKTQKTSITDQAVVSNFINLSAVEKLIKTLPHEKFYQFTPFDSSELIVGSSSLNHEALLSVENATNESPILSLHEEAGFLNECITAVDALISYLKDVEAQAEVILSADVLQECQVTASDEQDVSEKMVCFEEGLISKINTDLTVSDEFDFNLNSTLNADEIDAVFEESIVAEEIIIGDTEVLANEESNELSVMDESVESVDSSLMLEAAFESERQVGYKVDPCTVQDLIAEVEELLAEVETLQKMNDTITVAETEIEMTDSFGSECSPELVTILSRDSAELQLELDGLVVGDKSNLFEDEIKSLSLKSQDYVADLPLVLLTNLEQEPKRVTHSIQDIIAYEPIYIPSDPILLNQSIYKAESVCDEPSFESIKLTNVSGCELYRIDASLFGTEPLIAKAEIQAIPGVRLEVQDIAQETKMNVGEPGPVLEDDIRIEEKARTTSESLEVEITPEDFYLNPNIVHVILEPINRATLSAQITSPVVAIERKMGETFKAGEVLIRLDDTVFAANLKKSVAIYKQAKLNSDMRMQLFEEDIGSLTELRDAQAKSATARAELALARKQVEACTIVAPYSGRVVDIRVQEYELAEANEPLMDIIGDDVLIAKMLVESTQLKNIAIGDIIKIHFDQMNITVPAKIVRVGAEIDPASSTIRVDAQIENPNLMLTAGMTGTAILPDKKSGKEYKITPTRRQRSSSMITPSKHGASIQIMPTFSTFDPMDRLKMESKQDKEKN